MTHKPLSALALAAIAGLAFVGCASQPDAADQNPSETTQDTRAAAIDGTVTVFAAASLTATFTELAEQFEAEHPGVSVVLNFGGSSGLLTQLTEGALVDVFASADENNMAAAEDQGLVTETPELFATNTLEIVVPQDNPAGVTRFADLAQPGLRLVVCAPRVPCGAATSTVADAVEVTLAPVSEEQSVTDVLGKVLSGEADAGLVYRTDVAGAAGRLLGIPFVESDLAVNRYPIALLADSPNPAAAQAFIDFVIGPVGLAVLTDAGFGAP